MGFLTKVTAAVDKTMLHSNAWDYLPSAAKNIFKTDGFSKLDFIAAVLPASSEHPKIRNTPELLLELVFKKGHTYGSGSGGSLHISDLKKLEALGVNVMIGHKRVTFIHKLKDFHDIKEDTFHKREEQV